MFNKRSLVFVLLVLSLMVIITSSVSAEYPEKKVDVIISYSAGGGTDVMARTVLPFVEDKLGVPFVIENKPGAGSQIGYTFTSMAKPDGYTMGNINTMSIVTMELTRENVAFKLKEDFQPVAQIEYDPHVVVVNKNSEFDTMEELLDYAKENPGQLSFGGTAKWSSLHVHMVMLERAAGVEFNYIPYDGSAGTKAAILGGHIDVAAGGVSEFLPQIQEGELKPLVVASKDQWPSVPEVPTYKELGYNIEMGACRGFAVPKGTPMERVNKLSNTIKEVMESPEFIAKAKEVGIYQILNYRGPEEYTEYLYNLQDEVKSILPEEEMVN